MGQSYTHPDFTVDPSFCPEPTYTYSETSFLDSTNSAATAITQSGKTSDFFWDTDNAPLGQTQTVTVTATSNSIYGAQNPSTEMDMFDLNFLDPCIDANFVTITETS